VQTVEPLLSDPAAASATLAEHAAAESSRLLLHLIELSQAARSPDQGDASSLEGIISPAILRRLLATLHFRDSATVQHCRRVSQLAVAIARHLRWEGIDLRRLEIAALLHDLGKIGVPDNVLFKPGKLNPDEADLLALHHRVGVDVLQAARVDPQVIQIVAESRDFPCATAKGTGRPLGTLHLGSRILSVADAYDTLRTEQVYRHAKSHEEAMRILVENTGTQFDGNVINALMRWAGACGLNKSAEYRAENLPAETGQVFVDPREARDADALSRIFAHLYLLENLYNGFYIVDADLRFVVWNGAAQRLMGHAAENLLDHPWSSRTICYSDETGRDMQEGEIPIRQVLESRRASDRDVKILNQSGCWVDVELQTVPLIDSSGTLRGVAEIFRDRSQTLASHEYRDLQLSDSRDPLTGVANQEELRSQLAQTLERAHKDEWKVPCSMIVVELDRFDEINDRFGNATADLVLIEVARMLQQETYSGELVSRHGGGRFMIVCPATTAEQANKRADRLRMELGRLGISELEGWPLTGSFGITQAVAGDGVDSVLCRADKALYSATRGGGDQTFFVSASEHPEPLLRESGPSGASFEFEAQFLACTAAEMIVYKLGGFVNEHDADLLEVTRERVRMRLGRCGLLSSWGKTNERRPVEVDLGLGSEAPLRDVNGRKVKSNQIRVTVKITPVGRVKDRDIFLERARYILKELSKYFLAEV